MNETRKTKYEIENIRVHPIGLAWRNFENEWEWVIFIKNCNRNRCDGNTQNIENIVYAGVVGSALWIRSDLTAFKLYPIKRIYIYFMSFILTRTEPYISTKDIQNATSK